MAQRQSIAARCKSADSYNHRDQMAERKLMPFLPAASDIFTKAGRYARDVAQGYYLKNKFPAGGANRETKNILPT